MVILASEPDAMLKDLAVRPCFWERARRPKHARRKTRPSDSLKPGPGGMALKKPLFYQSSMLVGLKVLVNLFS